ncbi:FAD-dependent oxidoreductase [Klebsiella indica]|uniref:FAD-dependent oxidoreductase n=1 Tax=Klebsiella indica TaxID=2582917 RepID=A0A5R9LE52_9ENTR|nr:FAD-dependent oxidoreductase [Klebsiella indica]TLV10711.1 FAD-dependent oxidoreductase [Klebsiella indica]
MASSYDKTHYPAQNNLTVPGWGTPPPAIPDNKITQTITADILIIGAGCAGLFAAHSAAEQGLKVVVMEKFATFSARGMDNGAVNSTLQRKAGKDIDEDLLLSDLIRFANNRVHSELIALWVRQSGRVFDHYINLCEANGMKVALADTFNFATHYPDLYRQYPTAHIFANADQKISTGNEYIPTQQAFLGFIEKECKKLGVSFYYDVASEQLLREENGRVNGATGKTKEGEYIKFRAAHAVILASGGYSENQEMLDAWCPIVNKAEIKTYNPHGGNNGEVLAQALWINADLQNWPHPAMIHTIPGFHVDLMCGNQSFMHVNQSGKRFQCESLPNQYLVNGRFRQPGQHSWAIFDSRYESDHKTFQTGFDGPITEPIEILNAHADKGQLFRANTLDELARQIGLPTDTFVATCKRYSDMAHQGKDTDFNKEPGLMFPIEQAPFYAIPMHSHLLVTLGGLNCDPDMQVLDTQGHKIAGLYAVGNIQGNFFANEYPLMAPGLSHGRAITLSYVLGEQLAENIKATLNKK